MAITSATRKVVLSRGKEADFKTKVFTNATAVNIADSTFPVPEYEKITDQDLIGASLFPSESSLLSKRFAFAMNVPRVKPDFLALVLAYAMGDASAPIAAVKPIATKTDAAEIKRHFITHEDDDAELPTLSAHHIIADDNIEELTGCGCNDFRLAVQLGGNRMVSLDSNWIMGKRVKLTSGGQAGTQPSEPRMNGGFSSVFLSNGVFAEASINDTSPINAAVTNSSLTGMAAGMTAAPTITQFASRARTLELTYNNNINADSLYRLNSGFEIGAMTRGRPTVGLTMSFDRGDEDVVQLIDDGTYYSMEWIVNPGKSPEEIGADPADTIYYPSYRFIYPRLQYASVEPAVEDGIIVDRVTFDVLSQGTNGAFRAYIYNRINHQYAA